MNDNNSASIIGMTESIDIGSLSFISDHTDDTFNDSDNLNLDSNLDASLSLNFKLSLKSYSHHEKCICISRNFELIEFTDRTILSSLRKSLSRKRWLFVTYFALRFFFDTFAKYISPNYIFYISNFLALSIITIMILISRRFKQASYTLKLIPKDKFIQKELSTFFNHNHFIIHEYSPHESDSKLSTNKSKVMTSVKSNGSYQMKSNTRNMIISHYNNSNNTNISNTNNNHDDDSDSHSATDTTTNINNLTQEKSHKKSNLFKLVSQALTSPLGSSGSVKRRFSKRKDGSVDMNPASNNQNSIPSETNSTSHKSTTHKTDNSGHNNTVENTDDASTTTPTKLKKTSSSYLGNMLHTMKVPSFNFNSSSTQNIHTNETISEYNINTHNHKYDQHTTNSVLQRTLSSSSPRSARSPRPTISRDPSMYDEDDGTWRSLESPDPSHAGSQGGQGGPSVENEVNPTIEKKTILQNLYSQSFDSGQLTNSPRTVPKPSSPHIKTINQHQATVTNNTVNIGMNISPVLSRTLSQQSEIPYSTPIGFNAHDFYNFEFQGITPEAKNMYIDRSYSHSFKVRGPTYMSDNKKMDPGPAMFKLMLMEIYEVEPKDVDRHDHIVTRGLAKQRLETIRALSGNPFVFIMNVQVPGDPPVSLVNYFALPPDIVERFPGIGTERFLKLFEHFMQLPTDENERLHLWGHPPGSTVTKKIIKEDWMNDVSSIGGESVVDMNRPSNMMTMPSISESAAHVEESVTKKEKHTTKSKHKEDKGITDQPKHIHIPTIHTSHSTVEPASTKQGGVDAKTTQLSSSVGITAAAGVTSDNNTNAVPSSTNNNNTTPTTTTNGANANATTTATANANATSSSSSMWKVPSDVTWPDGKSPGEYPQNDFRHNRFKLIPMVIDGPWIIKAAVRSKPAITGTKLVQRYFRGYGYLELDIQIGSSIIASQIVALCRGYAKSYSIDMALVVQGETPDELPERLIGCACVNYVDVKLRQKLD